MSWTDHNGKTWADIASRNSLQFSYPLHAALRAFVMHRDGFACRRCPAKAVDVPSGYNGRFCLRTDTLTGAGTQDVLILDHILTLKAGGRSVPANLQALCETCNRRKQREDKAAIAKYREAIAA